ncbi:hypothetical protein ABZ499_26930 [Streptomyces sp. NPDC019990]|uniref:hypothetical protein n=1 Tax=Streptomyces sp. NPDC019990 TaxID=3154693 RepID=UPI0033DC8999
MTTCASTPRSNGPVAHAGPDDAAQPRVDADPVHDDRTDRAAARHTGAGPAGPDTAPPYGDAVSDLVHAAVADRPLEEVVAFITSLEESPGHAEAKVDALRTAGVKRSVEDVSRMIALLTNPPRDAACADEAIRAAAAHRPVAEVTRLVSLLHKEPHQPHVREQALRAAATGRSVEELVELVDLLGLERLDRNGPVPKGPSRPESGETAGNRPPARPAGRRAAGPYPALTTRQAVFGFAAVHRDRATDLLARSVSWSGWLAALAMAVCAVAHFPLQRDDASPRLHAFAFGLSALCTVLALLLALRPVAVVLAGAVVLSSVLAGAQAYRGSYSSSTLPQAVGLGLAPAWLATAAAVGACLLAGVTLVCRTVPALTGGPWAPGARRTAE